MRELYVEAVAKEMAGKFKCERCDGNERLFQNGDEITCAECLKKETKENGSALSVGLLMAEAMKREPYGERTDYCIKVGLPVPLYAMIGEGRINPKEG